MEIIKKIKPCNQEINLLEILFNHFINNEEKNMIRKTEEARVDKDFKTVEFTTVSVNSVKFNEAIIIKLVCDRVIENVSIGLREFPVLSKNCKLELTVRNHDVMNNPMLRIIINDADIINVRLNKYSELGSCTIGDSIRNFLDTEIWIQEEKEEGNKC